MVNYLIFYFILHSRGAQKKLWLTAFTKQQGALSVEPANIGGKEDHVVVRANPQDYDHGEIEYEPLNATKSGHSNTAPVTHYPWSQKNNTESLSVDRPIENTNITGANGISSINSAHQSQIRNFVIMIPLVMNSQNTKTSNSSNITYNTDAFPIKNPVNVALDKGVGSAYNDEHILFFSSRCNSGTIEAFDDSCVDIHPTCLDHTLEAAGKERQKKQKNDKKIQVADTTTSDKPQDIVLEPIPKCSSTTYERILDQKSRIRKKSPQITEKRKILILSHLKQGCSTALKKYNKSHGNVTGTGKRLKVDNEQKKKIMLEYLEKYIETKSEIIEQKEKIIQGAKEQLPIARDKFSNFLMAQGFSKLKSKRIETELKKEKPQKSAEKHRAVFTECVRGRRKQVCIIAGVARDINYTIACIDLAQDLQRQIMNDQFTLELDEVKHGVRPKLINKTSC